MSELEHYFNCYVKDSKKLLIEIGSHHILEIDKIFGPTIFARLKISCEFLKDFTGYIIYRETCNEQGENIWIEITRISAQISSDFKDSEPNSPLPD